ncbi:MAG: head-tail adaptor protein [Pseudomonadota bacterium]
MSARLDTRLTLESPVATPDGGGGSAIVWTPLGVLWAEIVATAGREITSGDRPTSRVSHRITVRRARTPADRPRPEQRLTGLGRTFAIRAVADDDPRALTLTLWAEEGPVS